MASMVCKRTQLLPTQYINGLHRRAEFEDSCAAGECSDPTRMGGTALVVATPSVGATAAALAQAPMDDDRLAAVGESDLEPKNVNPSHV